ncbi:sulfotransferase 1B1-like isoform X2 [Babylonia areolata]
MLKTGSPHLSSRRMENTGFLMISSCAQLDSLPCPRVLTTHHRFHDLPLDFILRRRKMVCILRDPKDVCVSSYHMNSSLKHTEYDGTFQGFIPLFLAGHVPLGSWFGWILSFERGLKEHPELSVHVIHYEHLKADPAGEIKRLAKYLDAPESLAEEVARQTEFSAMKTFKNSLDNSFAVYYKSNTDSIFRKGEAHQWKQYFTPEQAEQFDAQLAKHLGRSSVVAKL